MESVVWECGWSTWHVGQMVPDVIKWKEEARWCHFPILWNQNKCLLWDQANKPLTVQRVFLFEELNSKIEEVLSSWDLQVYKDLKYILSRPDHLNLIQTRKHGYVLDRLLSVALDYVCGPYRWAQFVFLWAYYLEDVPRFAL